MPLEPVQGRAPGRALRGPDEVDVRGPRAGLQARGRAARDGGRPALGVRHLGRLRRRRGRRVRRRRRRGPGGGRRGPNTKKNLQGSRNKRLDAWIQSIRNTKRPALNFKHVLLPHVPWQYLPDGRQYRRVATEPIPGISRQTYKDAGPDRGAPAAPPAAGGLRRPRAPGADRPPQEGGAVGQGDGHRDRRPRRLLPPGPVRPAQGRRQEHRRDLAGAAVHQGARPAEAQGQPRGGGDHRHPADDPRRAAHRSPREDGRPLGLLAHGARPHAGQDAHARLQALDPDARDALRPAAPGRHRPARAALRQHGALRRPLLPHRAQPAAAGPAGALGRAARSPTSR